MTSATPLQDRMREKLTAAFHPTRLEIIDDSARHKGHAGYDPRGETHFILRIVSLSFAGKSRVECHRMIYSILDAELKDGVHALAIEAYAKEVTT